MPQHLNKQATCLVKSQLIGRDSLGGQARAANLVRRAVTDVPRQPVRVRVGGEEHVVREVGGIQRVGGRVQGGLDLVVRQRAEPLGDRLAEVLGDLQPDVLDQVVHLVDLQRIAQFRRGEFGQRGGALLAGLPVP
ncbi:hypothetical protein SAMN05661093_01096 [Kibdelosporangium aridum]|uniref:Uncharacterized protein n=1 Tax=Kibdelosporangium aridum TaxID=2030 RepID=A0A1W2AUQ9_KIBAR|nr:hypothetical protein [Kibdelosporangium aridum]SMC63928.1 hypothetical protein SAMN05661093_01096 [Kibdelosporangium aridum]